ncbi:MAG: hypothetical protein KDD94_15410, partial [Calditrichaeota bacterium]|nr:hypothetical protein [Calditrichota bacterium]
EETAQLTGNNLLLVIGDEFDIRAKRPKIRIASSAYVEGMIVYSAPPASSYRDQFTPFDISSQTKLKGIIYSPFAISSELNIDGLICLNYFEFNYGGTRYQNYIKDLTINALESYNGFSIFEKGERYLAQSIEVE